MLRPAITADSILEATAITRRSALTQPSDAHYADQRSSLSTGENAAPPERPASVLRRLRRPVQLKVPGSSVENVVAAIRDKQEQEGRRVTLVLKVAGDGWLRARMPSTTRHIRPALTGQLEADGDCVMLRGVIREPVSAVITLRVYLGFAILMLLLAIIQAGHPVPGGIVCGACGILFGLTGYWLARTRRDGFSRDCEELIKEVTSVLPADRRHVRLSPGTLAALAEADRVLTRITRLGRPGRRRNRLR
jgi:hypothetical protein